MEILVARGFYKKEGINFEETLTPGSKVHFLQMVVASKLFLNDMIGEEF